MTGLEGAATEAVAEPAPTTVAHLLAEARPTWEVLQADYGPLLRLVDTILGVVPNCDRYLEIWPPAFRTYNVMVPNLLNLPVPILGLGGPPPHVIGLAMYVASRTAACPYCTAHSCSFAMRRGASAEQVAAAMLPHGADGLGRGELAAVSVARSLARVPAELTMEEREELIAVFGPAHAEWIVLAIAMMGFLNKFMDAVGVELEQAVVSEVGDALGEGWTAGRAGGELDPAAPTAPPPPIDRLRTRLRLLPLLPAAIRYDRRAQRGTPARSAAVASYLTSRVGHDFPALAPLRSSRARRAVATMLAENLDPRTTVVGLGTKASIALQYAEHTGNVHLVRDAEALAAHHDTRGAAGDATTSSLLLLAEAATPSPANVDKAVLDTCIAAGVPADAYIEVITWLSVLQLLHRLSSFTMLGR